MTTTTHVIITTLLLNGGHFSFQFKGEQLIKETQYQQITVFIQDYKINIHMFTINTIINKHSHNIQTNTYIQTYIHSCILGLILSSTGQKHTTNNVNNILLNSVTNSIILLQLLCEH